MYLWVESLFLITMVTVHGKLRFIMVVKGFKIHPLITSAHDLTQPCPEVVHGSIPEFWYGRRVYS